MIYGAAKDEGNPCVVDFHELKRHPTIAAVFCVLLCGIVAKHVNSTQSVDSSCRGSLTAHVIYLTSKLGMSHLLYHESCHRVCIWLSGKRKGK